MMYQDSSMSRRLVVSIYMLFASTGYGVLYLTYINTHTHSGRHFHIPFCGIAVSQCQAQGSSINQYDR